MEEITQENVHLSLGEQVQRYTQILNELEEFRNIDEKRLLQFAEYLKEKEGQKYVYLFYEREYLPKIDPVILNQYLHIYQDRQNIIHSLTELFQFHRRDISFNVDRVKQAYADTGISIHFMFLTPPSKHIPGLRLEEQSEDIFSAFREIVHATGGFEQSSANPKSIFKDALESTENYYLIYYIPRNYTKDGKFRKIEVKVKNRKYKIVQRAGYIAN